METPCSPQAIYQYALLLLSRREHSRAELKQKIMRRFGKMECSLIDSTLERLAADNYQSDLRFAESFIHSRLQRGYGLSRIKLELRQKGIAQDQITSQLHNSSVQEQEQQQLERMWRKKFNAQPKNNQERYKQQYHLANKGFRKEVIEQFFRCPPWGDE